MGLLSLAAFATRQRQKEVGVRKVMGASVSRIVILLSSNLARLVVIAFIIACPLFYDAGQQFLEDFAYKINLSVDIFVVTGVVAFMIAGISVGFQALKAAMVNPTASLRND